MMYNSWVNLNHHWQSLLYKEWLLFIKERFPLSTFLWDDSYGLDFLLCKALNLETSKPEDDVQNLNSIIKDELVSLQESTINDIFDMEFLALDSSITYLSPLKDFKKLKVLDFHCTNESCITDFLALENHSLVYVLDYADYQSHLFPLYHKRTDSLRPQYFSYVPAYEKGNNHYLNIQ